MLVCGIFKLKHFCECGKQLVRLEYPIHLKGAVLQPFTERWHDTLYPSIE